MILILDEFLNECGIEKLINYFKNNQNNASEWHGTKTIDFKEFSDLIDFLNNFSIRFNARVDWGKIVHWPAGSFQPLHLDNASDETMLTSVIYLNEDFKSGETYFEDGTKVCPKKGRALFFDGKKYKHGVNQISDGDRFTLAVWYKKL